MSILGSVNSGRRGFDWTQKCTTSHSTGLFKNPPPHGFWTFWKKWLTVGGGFRCFYFLASIGDDPIWLIFFRWVVQPPTCGSCGSYCWWFRNPKQPPFGCYWNLVNNGINCHLSTGDRQFVSINSTNLSMDSQNIQMTSLEDHQPGQIIATSHDRFPPNGALVRVIPGYLREN